MLQVPPLENMLCPQSMGKLGCWWYHSSNSQVTSFGFSVFHIMQYSWISLKRSLFVRIYKIPFSSIMILPSSETTGNSVWGMLFCPSFCLWHDTWKTLWIGLFRGRSNLYATSSTLSITWYRPKNCDYSLSFPNCLLENCLYGWGLKKTQSLIVKALSFCANLPVVSSNS